MNKIDWTKSVVSEVETKEALSIQNRLQSSEEAARQRYTEALFAMDAALNSLLRVRVESTDYMTVQEAERTLRNADQAARETEAHYNFVQRNRKHFSDRWRHLVVMNDELGRGVLVTTTDILLRGWEEAN